MFKVACIQLSSGRDLKKNLISSKKLILKAIKLRSDFIITPENSSLFGLNFTIIEKILIIFML